MGILSIFRKRNNKDDVRWTWCLKGRVIGDHPYGQDGEIRSGTKAFEAGTDVYVAPPQWGDGFENVVVIGTERRKGKLIELVMRCKHIVGFEVVKVEDPNILEMIESSDSSWWGDTDEDYEAIKHLAESINSQNQDMIDSFAEGEKWQYGIVANIVDKRVDEEGILRHGTAAYPPGRKVYIGKHVSYNEREVEVLGINRFGRYVVEWVPILALENIRCKRIYKPGALAYMGEYEGGYPFWSNQEEDKKATEKHAEWMRMIQGRIIQCDYIKTECFSMMGMRSILKMMIDHLDNGYLDSDFLLPDENPEEEIKWGDGALDGVYIYHMGHEPANEMQQETIDKVFRLVSERNKVEALDLLYELSKDLRAIAAIDDIRNVLIANQDSYDLDRVMKFGCDLFTDSNKRELIKYGLLIIELFADQVQFRKEFKDLVKIIALNDEFTLFAMFVMFHWEDPNHIMYQLGQRVYGWGRIHVVDYIIPDSEEIKRWILSEGINNSIDPAYSARACFIKTNVPDILYRYNLSYDDIHSVGEILRALVNEGPVAGISAIDNAGDVLELFLDRYKNYDLKFDDYCIVKDIFDYVVNDDTYYPELVEKCSDILLSDVCRGVVTEAINRGKGVDLAKHLGIDYQKEYFRYFKEHAKDEMFNLAYDFDEEYVEAVLDVYRANLDFESLAKGADVKIPLPEQFGDYLRLDACLSMLAQTPMKGKDFVTVALDSPVLRNRKSAIDTIASWIEITGLPLKELDQLLYDKLENLERIETNEEILERIASICER